MSTNSPTWCYADPSHTYRKVNGDCGQNRAAGGEANVLQRDTPSSTCASTKPGRPYFTDVTPTLRSVPTWSAFTEILKLHGVKFETVLASLMSKYAKKSNKPVYNFHIQTQADQ
jgi:hypothetical protein